jgi:hypothetical protein
LKIVNLADLAELPPSFTLPGTLIETRILLDVELGVIEALRPVIRVIDAEVVLKVSVLVVDTTCKTLPAGNALDGIAKLPPSNTGLPLASCHSSKRITLAISQPPP